jgi:hypothetical protein
MKITKTREEKRNERAEKVCREVRFQMANHGGIVDNQTLFDLLEKWMRVAKKHKYERP